MKLAISLLVLCVSLGAQVTPFPGGEPQFSVNPVVYWNRILLGILQTPGAQPATVHPTRSYAMMHAAVYDAVNSIDGGHRSYLNGLPTAPSNASEDAAAATAAHDVLVALYPKFQTNFDAWLAQSLAAIPAGQGKNDAVTQGQKIAALLVAARSSDGSAAIPAPYVYGTNPGDFQSTPPNFPTAVFTQWSRVTPFLLQQASQFRPPAPPALTSSAYSDTLNEVQSLGQLRSTTASVTQTLEGRFWNGAVQNYWNEIAQTAAVAKGLSTAQSARLFGLLNLTFADSVIAFYDAKYTYARWRPISAIRATVNPTWLPQVGNTPADPSYPGAHAVLSYAAVTVLDSVLGSDQLNFAVTSEVMAGVHRSFTNFSDAATEAATSRIYAGVHFRVDLTAGQPLGVSVANLVLASLP